MQTKIDSIFTKFIIVELMTNEIRGGRSHKTFLEVKLLTLFVSYTILELWKHIVNNNEMVYLTQNPE